MMIPVESHAAQAGTSSARDELERFRKATVQTVPQFLNKVFQMIQHQKLIIILVCLVEEILRNVSVGPLAYSIILTCV